MTVTKRKAKPITAHPLFPIVTSLWFAAFLSLGSFAVAPQLLEGPVVALGIPEILPAAQPPLGFTVRALLALVMLGVGGLAGFFIGRALAGGKVDSPVRARSFGQHATKVKAAKASAVEPMSEAKPASSKRSSHRRPLNPVEDLGEPMSAPFSGETYAPVDPQALEGLDFIRDPAEYAPLPWEQEHRQRAEEADTETTHLALQPMAQSLAQRQAQLDDPLALDLLLSDAEVISKGPAPFDTAPFETAPFDQALADQMPADAAPSSSAAFFQTTAPDQDRVDEAEPQDDILFAEADATLETGPESVPESGPETELPVQQTAPSSLPLIKTPLFQAPALAPTPLSRTPLEDLGLVQLTERLALALSRRHTSAEDRQPSVAHAFSPAEPAPEPVEVAVAREEEPRSGEFAVVQPQPAAAIARFGTPEAAVPEAATPEASAPTATFADAFVHDERVVQLRPNALQPFAPEPEALEDDAPEFERFLRVREPKVATDSPASDFDDEDLDSDDLDQDEFLEEDSSDSDEDMVFTATGAEADVAEERYPSLLNMGAGSLRHRALNATSPLAIDLSQDAEERHEDDREAGIEPAVVFPGQEAHLPSPFETTPRLFERPAGAAGGSDRILPVPGSPLAAPGRAAPSSPIDALGSPAELQAQPYDAPSTPAIDAEEADRALRAALATLQRMTAQG